MTNQGNMSIEEVKQLMDEERSTALQTTSDRQTTIVGLNDVAPQFDVIKNVDVQKLHSFYLIGAELIVTQQGGKDTPTIVFAIRSDELPEPKVFFMSLNRADGNPHPQRLKLYEALGSDSTLQIGPVKLVQVPTDKGNPAWAFAAAPTQPVLPTQGKANK